MAVGGVDFNQIQQMQAVHRQHQAIAAQMSVGPGLPQNAKNSHVPSGSLIVADFFSPTPGMTASHGETVNAAARRDGFKGPVFTLAQPTLINRVSEKDRLESQFFNPKATPGEVRQNVANYAQNSALDVLESQTMMVKNAAASGAKNSVLNLSMGGSVAQVSNMVYNTAAGAWNPKASADDRAGSMTVAKNLAGAYGLDVSKLTSADAKVSGPERVKLQEAISKGVSGSLAKDPAVIKAKRTFATEVGRFESGRNSVVISAGNEGDIRGHFKKNSGGGQAKLPSDFETNFLDTPAATVVGATRWSNGANGPTEKVAGYSSASNGLDIYASGSLDMKKDGKGADTFGTSFAAPRVAATMATLHKQNPQMSSAQIEHLMKTKFTHQLETSSGSVSVLDYHKSSDLMVGRASQ